MRKILFGFMSAAIVASGAGFYFAFRWPEPPQEYMSIALGDSKEEVRYKRGIPTQVLADIVSDDPKWSNFQRVYDVSAKDGPNALPEGKIYESFDEWVYEHPTTGSKQHIIVAFNQSGHVHRVTCSDITGSKTFCEPLVGVQIGDFEPDVVRRLGAPSNAKIKGVAKSIVFENLNLGLTFTQQRAYMLELARPAKLRE